MTTQDVHEALLDTRAAMANDPELDARTRATIAQLPLCVLADVVYEFLGRVQARSGWLTGRAIAAVHGRISGWRSRNCAPRELVP
jgi:hypothetical protein